MTKITKKFDSSVIIYESEKETMKETVVEAIKKGVSLSDSDLRGSDLSDSDLSNSNLSYSDLSDSDLSGSNLSGSDLSGSDFYHAKFYGRGGKTKIKKEQIESFFEALGVIVE